MIAFAKNSGPSFGLSEKSMSSSRIASIRFQSVLDRLFVFFPLFMMCPSQPNDSNGLGCTLCKNDYGRSPANGADSPPTLFSVNPPACPVRRRAPRGTSLRLRRSQARVFACWSDFYLRPIQMSLYLQL